MIYILLSGGLGNQLFQYALYKELECSSLKVSLDFSHLELFHEHTGASLSSLFNDKVVNIEKDKFNKHFIRISYGKLASRILWQLKKMKDLLLNRIVITEKNHGVYDELIIDRLSKIKRDVTLMGYWQSENYFKDVKETLLANLNYSSLNDEKNSILLNSINMTNSVSIHIRRGDYLSEKNKSSHYIFYTLEYYSRAISYLKSHCINPVFYIFSDDTAWVKSNLNIEFATYIDWNVGNNSYKDLLLMSKCKHNIIANSSFSWWGAWLNSNDKKIVIAPEIWMNNIETPDIIPCSWIKLPV